MIYMGLWLNFDLIYKWIIILISQSLFYGTFTKEISHRGSKAVVGFVMATFGAADVVGMNFN